MSSSSSTLYYPSLLVSSSSAPPLPSTSTNTSSNTNTNTIMSSICCERNSINDNDDDDNDNYNDNMLDFDTVQNVVQSWFFIKSTIPNYEQIAGELLFRKIFELAPEAIDMFPFANAVDNNKNSSTTATTSTAKTSTTTTTSTSMMYQSSSFQAHAKSVVQMLETAINMLGPTNMGPLSEVLEALGSNHVAYGVLPEHYEIVGKALLHTVETALGGGGGQQQQQQHKQQRWTPNVQQGWMTVYKFISSCMIQGAQQRLQQAQMRRQRLQERIETAKQLKLQKQQQKEKLVQQQRQQNQQQKEKIKCKSSTSSSSSSSSLQSLNLPSSSPTTPTPSSSPPLSSKRLGFGTGTTSMMNTIQSKLANIPGLVKHHTSSRRMRRRRRLQQQQQQHSTATNGGVGVVVSGGGGAGRNVSSLIDDVLTISSSSPSSSAPVIMQRLTCSSDETSMNSSSSSRMSCCSSENASTECADPLVGGEGGVLEKNKNEDDNDNDCNPADYFLAIERVYKSWDIIKSIPDYEKVAGVLLFKKIFELAPGAKSLYSFYQQEQQYDDSTSSTDEPSSSSSSSLYDHPLFIQHAVAVVRMLDTALHMMGPDLDIVTQVLEDLGARHVQYGVIPDHYPIVGQALLSTLELALGGGRGGEHNNGAWTKDVQSGWTTIFSLISSTMIKGAKKVNSGASATTTTATSSSSSAAATTTTNDNNNYEYW